MDELNSSKEIIEGYWELSITNFVSSAGTGAAGCLAALCVGLPGAVNARLDLDNRMIAGFTKTENWG